MRLTKKHLNKLFEVEGSDGSWIYQLLDIKKGENLFYDFDGNYVIESNKYKDWKFFKPQKFSREHVKYGWSAGKRDKEERGMV